VRRRRNRPQAIPHPPLDDYDQHNRKFREDRVSRFTKALLLTAALPLALAAPADAQTKVKVGSVRATVVGAVVAAKERGYFKQANLDVDIELIDASASFIAPLSTGALNVVEGGMSAGLFNGIAQGLPIKSAFDSASSPVNHWLMLRPDLANEVKTVKDLKGRVVAINAPNSIALYEVTRILETAGLTIKDVETKVIPFPQMGIAFQNKAIDAGLSIAPFNQVIARQGIANLWINSDETIKTRPIQISTSMFNTDWAAKNPEVAQAFFTALLRGVRDYCNAYHGGSWRPELLKLLVTQGVGTSTEQIDSIPWAARNPDGYVFRDSATDVQKWYVQQGLVRELLPFEKTVDTRFAEAANKALGPFKVENAASPLKGCGK
jgi:NitT/TauT family transport system substrate-binding protein